MNCRLFFISALVLHCAFSLPLPPFPPHKFEVLLSRSKVRGWRYSLAMFVSRIFLGGKGGCSDLCSKTKQKFNFSDFKIDVSKKFHQIWFPRFCSNLFFRFSFVHGLIDFFGRDDKNVFFWLGRFTIFCTKDPIIVSNSEPVIRICALDFEHQIARVALEIQKSCNGSPIFNGAVR